MAALKRPKHPSRPLAGASDPSPFTVVVPVFDEERAVLVTLDGLHRAIGDSAHRQYEIIVVDDGSRDGTRELLATEDGWKVIRHAENRGYGAALKTGIAAATHSLIVIMDADGTYPASAVPGLIDACSGCDMVVGARIGERVHATLLRSAVKWMFRQAAQCITGARIPDLNSGLRVFHRRVAERFMDVLPDGFSFTTTITVASLVEGLSVRFQATDYMPRIGRSKLRPIRDTFKIGRQLVRLGVRFAPLRTSVCFATVLALASVAWGSAHMIATGEVRLHFLAGLVTAIAAIGLGAVAQQRVRHRRVLEPAGAARGE